MSAPLPRANFSTRIDKANRRVLLRDLDGLVSITNDAETVVRYVLDELEDTSFRIYYRDTNGDWDELAHDKRRFTHFHTTARDQQAEFARYCEDTEADE